MKGREIGPWWKRVALEPKNSNPWGSNFPLLSFLDSGGAIKKLNDLIFTSHPCLHLNHSSKKSLRSKIYMTDNYVNWQVFRRDSEAGRLLSRLYNTNTSSQRVNYPKAKQRRRPRESGATKTSSSNNVDDQKRPWKTTYTCHGWNKVAEEERESERKINIQRALSLNVPKVGVVGRGESRHTIPEMEIHAANKVDQIPRRRSELTCLQDQADIGFANKKYRPPYSVAKSSSEEKQRLARVFGTSGEVGGGEVPKSHLSRNENEPNTLFDQIFRR
jgi:hypothetical protein